MVKCFIYARVSTDEQTEGDYNSIDSQIDICKHYIQMHKERNWQFVKVYTDPGFSGKNLERPGIQRLIEDIKTGKVDVIIVYKIERLVRSLKGFYKLWDIFLTHNVTFVSATQQFDTSTSLGKLMLNILLSFAQFEAENTAEKTRDKMKQRAKRGLWHGGWTPFGYNYDLERKKLFINKHESAAVKRCYSMFNEGKKPSEIANNLNTKGIRTKARSITTKNGHNKKIGGNRFNEDRIKSIIKNPIYKGCTHSNGEEFKGAHKGIISIVAWEKANKQLNSKIPRRIEYAKDNYIHILKGIIKCGQCDTSMTPYPSGKKDKNGKPYLYYACGNVADYGKDSNCKVRMLPAREFENTIKKVLKDLGQNKALIESAIKNTTKLNKKKTKPLEAEKEKTEQQLTNTIKEINRLIKIMKTEDMVGKEITNEYKELLKERSCFETQKEKLELDIERCKQDMVVAETIKETLLAFDKVINILPIEDQKELFQLLFKEIRVWSFDPGKEKTPRGQGAFITKIRTKWYKIRLNLYQFPDIGRYYQSLSKQKVSKASSDFNSKWLPG